MKAFLNSIFFGNVLFFLICFHLLCVVTTANANEPQSDLDVDFYQKNIAKFDELTLINGHNHNDNTVIIRLMVLHDGNSSLITLISKDNELLNRIVVKTRRKSEETHMVNESEIHLDKHYIDSLSHILMSSEYGDLKSKVIDFGEDAAPSLWVYQFIDKSSSFILTRQAPFFYSIQSALYENNVEAIQKFSILDTFGVMLWMLSIKEPLPVDK